MFVRLFQIEQVKSSKKSLAGAVYEQENKETKTKSVLGDLKKTKLEQIFEQSSATRQVHSFTNFTFLFIV